MDFMIIIFTNDFVFVMHIVLKIFPNRARVVSALFYPSLETERIFAILPSKKKGYSPSFPRRRKDTRHPSLEEERILAILPSKKKGYLPSFPRRSKPSLRLIELYSVHQLIYISDIYSIYEYILYTQIYIYICIHALFKICLNVKGVQQTFLTGN